jgi:hypothetical protein
VLALYPPAGTMDFSTRAKAGAQRLSQWRTTLRRRGKRKASRSYRVPGARGPDAFTSFTLYVLVSPGDSVTDDMRATYPGAATVTQCSTPGARPSITQ